MSFLVSLAQICQDQGDRSYAWVPVSIGNLQNVYVRIGAGMSVSSSQLTEVTHSQGSHRMYKELTVLLH
jgi:hypothetical protein